MPPSIVRRLMEAARRVHKEYRFQPTELHVHPYTHNVLRHECEERPGRLWEIRVVGGDTEDYIHTPVGPLRVVQTETVPPDSLQLRREEPRQRLYRQLGPEQ